MEKAYKERKELERISGYYGEFKNYHNEVVARLFWSHRL